MGRSQADHREASAALRKIPNLGLLLNSELKGPNKYLALEIISSLSVKSALPELIRLSENDENGAVHLTLASLIDEKNAHQIQLLFRSHLIERRNQPVVVQVVLLDTLARFRTPLSKEILLTLFKSEESELRLSVLNFINLQADKEKTKIYRSVIDLALTDSTDAVRLRAAAVENRATR